MVVRSNRDDGSNFITCRLNWLEAQNAKKVIRDDVVLGGRLPEEDIVWNRGKTKMLIEILCIFNTIYIVTNILIYLYKKYIWFYLKRNYLKILGGRGLKQKKKKQIFEFSDEDPQEEFDESCVKKIDHGLTDGKEEAAEMMRQRDKGKY